MTHVACLALGEGHLLSPREAQSASSPACGSGLPRAARKAPAHPCCQQPLPGPGCSSPGRLVHHGNRSKGRQGGSKNASNHLTQLAQGIGGNLQGHPELKGVSSAYRETNPRPFLDAALAPRQSQLTSLLGSTKRKMNLLLKPAALKPSSLLLPRGFPHMWEQGELRMCLCCCVAGCESPQTTHLG